MIGPLIRKSFVGLSLLGLLNSCSDQKSERYVNEELMPFFESFEAEAASRGVSVDFESLQIEGFIRITKGEKWLGNAVILKNHLMRSSFILRFGEELLMIIKNKLFFTSWDTVICKETMMTGKIRTETV